MLTDDKRQPEKAFGSLEVACMLSTVTVSFGLLIRFIRYLERNVYLTSPTANAVHISHNAVADRIGVGVYVSIITTRILNTKIAGAYCFVIITITIESLHRKSPVGQ